ncbi:MULTISPECIES: integrase [unclassified Pseudomonas]|uniref:integrase n=1 Tax=unclassified Pseudomonas TaxID=196821 RepID=UPI0004728E8D|nr:MULTISPECIES: integrase [unclassified Pseudomonas]
MSNSTEALRFANFAEQFLGIDKLADSERDKEIVTAKEINGKWIILSRYGDQIWQLDGFPNNVIAKKRKIDFCSLPAPFRAIMKQIIYRYIRRGLIRTTRPRGGTVVEFFEKSKHFLRHLETMGIEKLSAITPDIASAYIDASKNQKTRLTNSQLSTSELMTRYIAVENIYELSQYTDQPMQEHPWPDTSARAIAGRFGIPRIATTPLLPDDVFCSIFAEAHQQLEQSKKVLDLRDELDAIAAEWKGRTRQGLNDAQNRYLKTKNWQGGIHGLHKSLTHLRTSCYIILASTSGCRNHELANLQLGAHSRTESDDGTIYHWMRSKSEKTDAGYINWMIPEIGVRALRTMERWSAPYRAMIAAEIAELGRINRHDPQIEEASKHKNSLFLGFHRRKNQVRTLSVNSWNYTFQGFSKEFGLSWRFATHQFRRKFANYAAHSQFGDIRYLKEHFAHWSIDMTLGYAMDDDWGKHLDLELYTEIQQELSEIKTNTVRDWMTNQNLAGGYGAAIKKWQREPENLLIFPDPAAMFKSIAESTAIRSNGHAWCTAENDGCVGNSMERTRCGGGCVHSVIGETHAPIYQGLYNNLKELRNAFDIGESGRKRVERDLSRCRDVLIQLGMPPENLIDEDS